MDDKSKDYMYLPFLYDRKNRNFFGRILVSRWRRRRRPKTFGFRTLTLVKVNRNL